MRPLVEPAFFARAFIEGGTLVWLNGLELTDDALRQRATLAGLLIHDAA